MASEGRKKEKLIILEEIYQDDKSEKKSKFSFKKYFQDPKNSERALSGAIVFFGLAAVALGFFQIKSNIYGSLFTGNLSNTNASGNDPTDLLGLRQKDTDQDGLSDYDELNLYKTSPYLQDSDSDGVSDQREIVMGTDPICHPNQNCFAAWEEDTGETGISQETDSLDPDMEDLLLTGKLKASQLRTALEDSGMSKEQISIFSDEDLLKMYQDILAENGASQVSSAENISLSDSDKSIENLTSAEIRSLLLESGISSDMLKDISDAELMQLVQDTLATY